MRDATAAPKHPELGDGYPPAVTNVAFIANAVWTTDEAVKAMEVTARRQWPFAWDDTGGTIWRVAYAGNDGARKEAAQDLDAMWRPNGRACQHPTIQSVFPFGELPDALRHMERGAHFGKIALKAQ